MKISKLSISMGLMIAAPITFAQYSQTNLVSDQAGQAHVTDPNLVNPWGLAASGSGPWWTSNNGSGTSTLYNGVGTINPLVVSIPKGANATGIVFNGSSGFAVAPNKPGRFLFAQEDGTISGWNPTATPTAAITVVDNSKSGAIYKGLGIQGNRLYAANFATNAIDVWDQNFNQLTSFTDPNVDAGYAPFNVQSLGGSLFVTYAKQAGNGDEVAGAGLGFVDQFAADGTFIKRIASHGALNAPWGVALAPSNFGNFSNSLLVGNFGDGRINAYDPTTGTFLGTLQSGGSDIAIDGLWGIAFGNGTGSGPTNSLYFAAGPGGEQHGLFGQIKAVPEPISMLTLAGGTLGLLRRRRKSN